MSTPQEPHAKPFWTVKITAKAKKQKRKLPGDMAALFVALLAELAWEGPVQPEWHHYGKLHGRKKETHHCHLNKDKPRYVAVWEVADKQVKLIEVTYAGTHENAPY